MQAHMARNGILVPAAALVALVGTFADATVARAQETPEQIVGGWLAQATAFPFLQVETGSVVHDVESGVTTVSDLHISAEIGPGTFDMPKDSGGDSLASFTYDIRFPEISFTGLSVDAEDYRAESIRVAGGSAAMEAKSETGDGDVSATTQIADYVIRDVRWSRLPTVAEDEEHPVSRFYPLAEALVDFDFSAAEIGPIVTVTRMPEGGVSQTVIYGPQQYGAARRGDIGSITMDVFSMSVHGADDDGAPVDVRMHAGPLTAESYNYGTLVRTFAPDGVATPDADRAYKPFVGALRMPGLAIDGTAGAQGVQFSAGLGSLAVQDVGVRAPQFDILGTIDELVVEARKADGAEPAEEDILRLIASFYGAFRLGLFEMSDLRFDVGDLASGAIGSIRIADLSADGLGEFSERGVDVRGPEGLVSKADTMLIEAVSFPSLDSLIGLGAAQEAGDVTAILKAVPTIGRILYSGLDVRVPGELEMQLDSGRLDMSGHIGPIPTHIDLEIAGLRLPAEHLETDARAQLQALGYDMIDASLSLTANWDEAGETARLDGQGELGEGGLLSLDAEIGGVGRRIFDAPQEAAMQLPLLTFNGATIRFEDDSLRDRVLRLVATQQNTTPDMVQQMATGMLPFMLAPLQRPDLIGKAADAAKRFFEGAGVLAVSSAPAEPVSLLGAMGSAQTDPGALVDSLNLTIDGE